MSDDAGNRPYPKQVADRREWLGVLAKTPLGDLEQLWQTVPRKPPYEHLRQPETGPAMVRARAGGRGQQFNLGEMTVSRCVVSLGGEAVGVGYVKGRDLRQAELVAVFDAMMQGPDGEWTANSVIEPLMRAQDQRRTKTRSKAARTRVEFFTMVRGDSF